MNIWTNSDAITDDSEGFENALTITTEHCPVESARVLWSAYRHNRPVLLRTACFKERPYKVVSMKVLDGLFINEHETVPIEVELLPMNLAPEQVVPTVYIP